MKSKIIISIPILFVGLFVMGQSTVYTPWGSEVSVWTQPDMIPSQRSAMDDSLAVEYPYAEFHQTLFGDKMYQYPSSSSKFNCHGYAWYMYWQNDEFDAPWNMHNTEAENYFNDPSFKVCSQAEADIWWINNGTHSALATDTQNELKSKWGTGPLATHGIGNNDSPYPISSVTYYKQCTEIKSGGIFYDVTLNYCAVKFNNTSVSSYVDLEVEYEEALLIEGTFTTGTGATLDIHPE